MCCWLWNLGGGGGQDEGLMDLEGGGVMDDSMV